MMGPRRRRFLGLVFLAGLALASCSTGAPADAGPAPIRSSASDATAAEELVAGAKDPGSSDESPTSGATTTVAVYLIDGELLERVDRAVPDVPTIGTEALRALLAGPTPAEKRAGRGTAIPIDTRLLDLTVSEGTAIVDLSRAFESGGGTLGLTLRLAQVACTLDQFDSVDGVRFALEGELLSVFSGDGIVLDRPVSCASYRTYLPGEAGSGPAPTKPAPRATPSSTTTPPDPGDSGDIGTFVPGDDGVHGGPAPGSAEDCAATAPLGPCDVGTFEPGADGVHGGPAPGSAEDCAATRPIGPC